MEEGKPACRLILFPKPSSGLGGSLRKQAEAKCRLWIAAAWRFCDFIYVCVCVCVCVCGFVTERKSKREKYVSLVFDETKGVHPWRWCYHDNKKTKVDQNRECQPHMTLLHRPTCVCVCVCVHYTRKPVILPCSAQSKSSWRHRSTEPPYPSLAFKTNGNKAAIYRC